ncbi:MAG: nicotinate-nucleotide adenylyltransferase [Firmicutes bacterium]|nr:nicotinate-nucleotide adenylyltransferase [Bacillota bacterium]
MSGKPVTSYNKIRKIGIFGGSFDPVHLGHTGLAEDAMKQAGLDKVIFIPARLQPFKLDKKLASGEDRLEMLKLAAGNAAGFEISTYELDTEGVSYSYLTMRAMREKYGMEVKLYFITGTDAFLKIDKWKNAEELLTEYSYVIGTRPGYGQDELKTYIESIREKYGTEIINIDNVQVDVSSTEIREMISRGQSTAGLISAEVERYIRSNGLYE